MEVLTKPEKRKGQSDVRNILNVYFPKTEFEINTKFEDDCMYQTVSYTDGVSIIRVKNAVKGFDRPANTKMHVPGVKVIVKRQMSHKVRTLILNEIKSIFRMEDLPQENDWFSPMNGTVGDYMIRIFNMRDF